MNQNLFSTIIFSVVILIMTNCNSVNQATEEKDTKIYCDNFENKWNTIIDKDGNFSIELPPCDVKKNKGSQVVNNQVIDVFSFNINLQNVEHFNLGYSVSSQNMVFHPDSVQSEFNAQRDYVIRGTNAVLENEIVLDTLDFYGREFYFSFPSQPFNIKYRIFIHKGKYYKLSVITEKEKLFNKSIERFFKSFKILK